jgi:hypothetical protein
MRTMGTMNKNVRIAVIAGLAAAAAAAVALFVVRDQMVRHQRDLFSPHRFRRLAALGHMSREEASVDNITLLTDFMAWEPSKLLRNRARTIHDRMESDALVLKNGSEEGTA